MAILQEALTIEIVEKILSYIFEIPIYFSPYIEGYWNFEPSGHIGINLEWKHFLSIKSFLIDYIF